MKSFFIFLTFFQITYSAVSQDTIIGNPVNDVITLAKKYLKKSDEKNKWSGGVYFIPCYLDYAGSITQNINLNLLAGIQLSKILLSNITLSTGLYYYRNNTHGREFDCYACFPTTWKTTVHDDFVEIALGLKFRISNSKKLKVFIMGGGVLSIAVYSKEIDTDINGKNHSYIHKGWINDGYPFLGLSFQYYINSNVYLLVDPTYRNQDLLHNWGFNSFSYFNFYGVGLGIGIKL